MSMTVQASKPFSGSQWSEVESLSARDAYRLQDQRLREQLAYLAARSESYRAKFAEHGIDPGTVRSVDDLAGLPFTEERVEPAEGAQGELVYTALRRQASPLVLVLRPPATGEMRIRVDFDGHSTQQPLPLVVEYAADLQAGRRDELRRTVEDRVRSALNVKTVVELVPKGTLKRPDHVKVALIERVHG
jgi:hypothetical protein